MKKRLLSMLLVLVMVLAMLPVSVLAEELEPIESSTEEIPVIDVPEQLSEEEKDREVRADITSNLWEMTTENEVYDNTPFTFVVTVTANDDIGKEAVLAFGFDDERVSAQYSVDGEEFRKVNAAGETLNIAVLADTVIQLSVIASEPDVYTFSAELSVAEEQLGTYFAFTVNCKEHVENAEGFCEKCGNCMHTIGDDGYCSLKDCAHEEGCWGCNGKDTTKPGGSEEYTGSYSAPTFEELAEKRLKVQVDCDHPDHDEPVVYDLLEGTWTPYVYELDGQTYCSILVDPDFYILMYSGFEGVDIEHTNATKNVPSFTLKYVDDEWIVENPVDSIITLYADCEEEREETWFVIEAASDRGGSVSCEGTTWVEKGADKTYYFYPDKGYEVSAVYVDGKIVNYYGICIDHHWSCKGCDDCWWIDWSQWYDCEHKWCDHKDCGYWHNGHWYAYDKCDHWYDSCYWGTWKNSITFYDVEDDHKLYVEFAKTDKDCASSYYWDLDADAWYHEATDFVINKGLMKGVGGNIFDPYGSTTRSELVTMLYRLAGEPKPLGTSAFADVAEGQWYTDAVIWAANKGIVTGYGDGTFGVEDVVTREQTVAILYRYAKWAGCDVSDLASLLNFVDVDEVSEYAEKPFGWAVEEDVIEGKPVSGWKLKLDPQGITERVEMAAMLMRFVKLVD